METKDKRLALVSGANQGIGYQVAKVLANSGMTVILGSRDLKRGEKAAKEIGLGSIAVQLDVTDRKSITDAAEYIKKEFGRLDVLINNAGISNTRMQRLGLSMVEYMDSAKASMASIDEMRVVWDTNVFGVLAVYQAMLPLLKNSKDARIVNVSSTLGSMNLNADPNSGYSSFYNPVYAVSKTALNGITLSMMLELKETAIKVNLVSPGFTKTAMTNFEGYESLEDGAREVVRVALLGPDGPTGTFTTWDNVHVPW
ncbi:SDR family oxidoreductase [Leptospira bandrabouensis]|uniref:SDR family oxidoreductase n=1 Tax=Leptospira bandrabouensis TaxID=2484903 RepID=A0A6H3NTQ6_9LEPT|nr:SDR family oxidoreductase [Leptospira bandrabouensis]MCG6143760.1 SDR family oxidoreductase [Leptospira bandrabouensis]MCG6151200.1 SDR family oxidoreductase [Leptospira bandrabouensis]MCG6159420.1 SDR family oxidoreductase [Leptospira bandrabouensis]MCG6163354.1 SDR family oxidoreductase [Leptospira bandrabouensis]MCW7457274.1 SDR family oxidoreductase [Leptospira bandrabouensis]